MQKWETPLLPGCGGGGRGRGGLGLIFKGKLFYPPPFSLSLSPFPGNFQWLSPEVRFIKMILFYARKDLWYRYRVRKTKRWKEVFFFLQTWHAPDAHPALIVAALNGVSQGDLVGLTLANLKKRRICFRKVRKQ